MATKAELIQRWDSFLNKMKEHYLESLEQAKEACFTQLEETDYDYHTVFRSWQGMKAQINLLIPKIEDTWKNKVEPQMEMVDDDSYFYLDEEKKASELTDNLHDTMESFQRQLEGELSQKFYNHVMAISNKDFNCTQCGSPITIKADVFRAQYVSCLSCNTVNTFEPNTKFAQIGSNIIDNIVALKLTPLYNKMNAANETIRALRYDEHSDDAWKDYKAAYFLYWDTFFNERIKLKSDAKERYEADIERKRIEYKNFEASQRYN